MKFKAINTKGEEVIANYFVGADEDVKHWCENEDLINKYGKELCYMFDNNISWVDSWELNGYFKDVVFTRTIEVIDD